jgi:hypothetical protein
MSPDELDKLAENVLARHAIRLGRPESIPMIPRPFTPRPRPQTVIVSEAAPRKIAERARAISMKEVLANALNRWGRGELEHTEVSK